MTGSARRLPNGRASIRLSPRARMMLAQRASARPRRRGAPVARTLASVLVSGLVVLVALGGMTLVAAAQVIGIMASGLPDPANLEQLTFSQPTIVYDRTGKVELARFEREKRRVVALDEVPRLVIDATTTAEDRTFWSNDGYDPGAMVAAAAQNISGNGSERGASTITQQLVRARLLPRELVVDGDRYTRKILEVIQAARLSGAFPGEDGKNKIMTAYLNQIYYGHEAYGIAAAADIYFGVTDLADLTPAQAALLAGLPKAPSVYDPYRYAQKDADGRLVVPPDSEPVIRRNYILTNLNSSRWTRLSPAELEAALREPLVLAGERPTVMRAPHFSWAVRAELERILGGAEAVETGGFRVITTLDWKAQQLAERYLYGGAIIPNLSREAAAAELSAMKFPKSDRAWINALRGKGVHNGALVALDYRSGDVLAYAGSAGYYRDDMASAKFQPQHDAAAAFRQPGSAFKPVLYATAFHERALTPGSLLLDISTEFGKDWAPKNADRFERGPALVRGALQQSLNLPAIRALERVGSEPVADAAEKLGLRFPGGRNLFLQGGLAAAIGTVETRPIDLAGAFGSFGNGGLHVPHRMVLSIDGPDGRSVFEAPKPEPVEAISPQAAFLITDILGGNTDPRQNRFWAATLALRNGPDGERRPAAAKTGTADARRDFATYGYLAPPDDPNAPALAVGVWMGNSDHSVTFLGKRNPPTSLTTAGRVWQAFMRDYTAKWPVASFRAPSGLTRARIDRWSGGKPGAWTVATITEWFIKGTEPGARHAVDPPGLLYTRACGGWRVDPVKAELGPKSWRDDVEAWVDRARRGPGVKGPLGSTTAYWFGQRSWGGTLIGPCERRDRDRDRDRGKPHKPGGTPPPPPNDSPTPAPDAVLPEPVRP